jgi:hypothetical protein
MSIPVNVYYLEIPPPVFTSYFKGFDHLIKSSGELLGVCRSLTSVWSKESRIVVYRLHRQNGNIKWVKVSNSADGILLLDK